MIRLWGVILYSHFNLCCLGSVSMDHFVAELRLCIRKKNSVSLMGCCAVTGEGLEPVMEQIENMIRLSKSLKRKIRIS